jgi:hypothetical protein
MALTLSISPKEFERVATAAYANKRLRVFLANLTTEDFDEESLVSDWETIVISGNGYADYKEVLSSGSYDNTDLRFELGGVDTGNNYVDAEYTASALGVGFTYNSVVVVVQNIDQQADISFVELTSNVATITTSAAHGLTTGDEVVIANATPSAFNGVYTVTGTPTATTFTYAKTYDDVLTVASVGTATSYENSDYPHSILTESPPISLAPSATMTYRIQVVLDD